MVHPKSNTSVSYTFKYEQNVVLIVKKYHLSKETGVSKVKISDFIYLITERDLLENNTIQVSIGKKKHALVKIIQ